MRRAQILAKKVSARAFAEAPGKGGDKAGEVGIEGTTIQAPDAVSFPCPSCRSCAHGTSLPLCDLILPFCNGRMHAWCGVVQSPRTLL